MNMLKLKKAIENCVIVGVENWGRNFGRTRRFEFGFTRFKPKEDFKIVMSHDPSHWDEKFSTMKIIII